MAWLYKLMTEILCLPVELHLIPKDFNNLFISFVPTKQVVAWKFSCLDFSIDVSSRHKAPVASIWGKIIWLRGCPNLSNFSPKYIYSLCYRWNKIKYISFFLNWKSTYFSELLSSFKLINNVILFFRLSSIILFET